MNRLSLVFISLAWAAAAWAGAPIAKHRTQLVIVEQVGPQTPPNAPNGRHVCLATVLIGADGSTTSVTVEKCDKLFHTNTRLALMTWRWQPVLVDGKPVPVQTVLPVVFDSHDVAAPTPDTPPYGSAPLPVDIANAPSTTDSPTTSESPTVAGPSSAAAEILDAVRGLGQPVLVLAESEDVLDALFDQEPLRHAVRGPVAAVRGWPQTAHAALQDTEGVHCAAWVGMDWWVQYGKACLQRPPPKPRVRPADCPWDPTVYNENVVLTALTLYVDENKYDLAYAPQRFALLAALEQCGEREAIINLEEWMQRSGGQDHIALKKLVLALRYPGA